uniref:Ankyrin-2-like n=1 Tax=Saccoglossus kowalevskii TaxID=10224 RepID=A0ABM0MD06_SACKO|nr:PREDICTED: ankyrin-2-like [Saccoglossus kowalevskii]
MASKRGNMSPNEKALMRAVKSAEFGEVSRLIIEQNVGVNFYDVFTQTPLMRACGLENATEIVALLLNSGANVNDQDKRGRTPLMLACTQEENIDVVKLLLDTGDLNPNLKDENKNTALMQNVSVGNHSVMQAMLEHKRYSQKLNVETVNDEGETPLLAAANMMDSMLANDNGNCSLNGDDIEEIKDIEKPTLNNICNDETSESNIVEYTSNDAMKKNTAFVNIDKNNSTKEADAEVLNESQSQSKINQLNSEASKSTTSLDTPDMKRNTAEVNIGNSTTKRDNVQELTTYQAAINQTTSETNHVMSSHQNEDSDKRGEVSDSVHQKDSEASILTLSLNSLDNSSKRQHTDSEVNTDISSTRKDDTQVLSAGEKSDNVNDTVTVTNTFTSTQNTSSLEKVDIQQNTFPNITTDKSSGSERYSQSVSVSRNGSSMDVQNISKSNTESCNVESVSGLITGYSNTDDSKAIGRLTPDPISVLPPIERNHDNNDMTSHRSASSQNRISPDTSNVLPPIEQKLVHDQTDQNKDCTVISLEGSNATASQGSPRDIFTPDPTSVLPAIEQRRIRSENDHPEKNVNRIENEHVQKVQGPNILPPIQHRGHSSELVLHTEQTTSLTVQEESITRERSSPVLPQENEHSSNTVEFTQPPREISKSRDGRISPANERDNNSKVEYAGIIVEERKEEYVENTHIVRQKNRRIGRVSPAMALLPLVDETEVKHKEDYSTGTVKGEPVSRHSTPALHVRPRSRALEVNTTEIKTDSLNPGDSSPRSPREPLPPVLLRRPSETIIENLESNRIIPPSRKGERKTPSPLPNTPRPSLAEAATVKMKLNRWLLVPDSKRKGHEVEVYKTKSGRIIHPNVKKGTQGIIIAKLKAKGLRAKQKKAAAARQAGTSTQQSMKSPVKSSRRTKVYNTA